MPKTIPCQLHVLMKTGEVFKYDNNFYQATKSVPKGTDLSDMQLPIDFNRGLVQIGENLPQKSQAAALTWPNGKDLAAGEIFIFWVQDPTSNGRGVLHGNDDGAGRFGTFDPSNSNSNFIRVGAYVDDSVQTVESLPEQTTKTSIDPQTGQPITTTQIEMSLEDGKVYYHQGSGTHFLVKAQPETIAGSQEFISAFNPTDAKRVKNFHIFKPNPNSGLTAPAIERRFMLTGWNVSGGALVEINVERLKLLSKMERFKASTLSIIRVRGSFD